jgi:hypothetical protein
MKNYDNSAKENGRFTNCKHLSGGTQLNQSFNPKAVQHDCQRTLAFLHSHVNGKWTFRTYREILVWDDSAVLRYPPNLTVLPEGKGGWTVWRHKECGNFIFPRLLPLGRHIFIIPFKCRIRRASSRKSNEATSKGLWRLCIFLYTTSAVAAYLKIRVTYLSSQY